MILTDADRQLLAPLIPLTASSEPYTFGRAGGSPADVAELDQIAARLLELSDEGVVEIVGAPMMDRARPGNHYYAIRARLTPTGSEVLGAELKRGARG